MMACQSGYQCDRESAPCLSFSAVCNNSMECPQGDDEINCIPHDDTLDKSDKLVSSAVTVCQIATKFLIYTHQFKYSVNAYSLCWKL